MNFEIETTTPVLRRIIHEITLAHKIELGCWALLATAIQTFAHFVG